MPADSLKHALRVFTRSPGFSAVTILILALGLGANTAIFTLLDALLFRPLPVSHPERLIQLSGLYRNGDKVPFSYPMFEELSRRQQVFTDLAGWSGVLEFNLEFRGALFPGGVRSVTPNYFSTLGIAPQLGTLLSAEHAQTQSAVISDQFWERHFARDPAALGGTLRIEGRPYTIIGITPRWFAGITLGESPDVTIPAAAPTVSLDSRALLWVFTTGRLNPSLTLPQARAQLLSFWPDLLTATVPTQSQGPRRQSFLAMGLNLDSATTGINVALRNQFVQPLTLLFAISGLILLIVCVSLANLTLARSTSRAYELSTRMALGASRASLIRQSLLESTLLSLAGAPLGLTFAAWGSRLLIALMSNATRFPLALDLRPDWRVLAFSSAAALLTALLIALAPAWQLTRTDPAVVLRGSPRTLGHGTGTLGKALIVAQISLSLILLQGAGLFLRSLDALRSIDPGFRKADVLEFSLAAQPGAEKTTDFEAYRDQLHSRILALPGVLSAGFASVPVPAGDRGWKESLSAPGWNTNPSGTLTATLVYVSPGFFQTLGIPLVSGRNFDATDDERRPDVAIADSALARHLPDGPIAFGVQPEFQKLQVVGVAREARLIDLRAAHAPVLYVPARQHPGSTQRGRLFVRAKHPEAMARTIDREIRNLGREYATTWNSLADASDQALASERATALLATFFAAVALLLAGLGVFGLMSYNLGRRTREIGIRLALGGQPAAIRRLILRETLLLALAGIAVGVPCAIAVTGLAAHLLFGPAPTDPVTLAAACLILFTVAALAGYFPARRAMAMDPLRALHYE